MLVCLEKKAHAHDTHLGTYKSVVTDTFALHFYTLDYIYIYSCVNIITDDTSAIVSRSLFQL